MDALGADARQHLLGDRALRAIVDEAALIFGGLVMQMLSATVRSGSSDSSWKMQTMPARLAAAGSAKVTGRPSNSMTPASGCTTPDIILISVDFPAPFSPSTAWMRPLWHSNRTSSSALTPP